MPTTARNHPLRRRSRLVLAGLLAVALTGLSVPGSSAEPGPDDTVVFDDATPSTLGGIPDGGTGCDAPGEALDVEFDFPDRPERITDVQLDVLLSHSFVGDVTLELRAPGGSPSFVIFGRTGDTTGSTCGDSSNLSSTYRFGDSFPGNWWEAAADAGGTDSIPSGDYRASEPGGAGATGAPTMISPAFADLPSGGQWILRVTDTAGGITGSISSARLTLTLDTTAPDTLVAGPPSEGKQRHRPAYELSSPDTDVDGFMCRVDNGSWQPCTSPFTPQVRQGRHSIKVVAFDTSTNVDQTAEERSFFYQTKRCDKAIKKFKKAKRAYKVAKQRGSRKAIKKAKKKYKKARKAKNRRCR